MTARYVACCACGEVELELTGAPVISLICHCDDCQAGSRLIEALPGAPAILDAGAGTPYALYRNDRVRCTKGAELLEGYKLKPASTTQRMVASCCNSAMLARLPSVLHWTPVYRDRIVPPAPPLEMRIQTRFMPADVALPADLPSVNGTPFTFVARMVGAKLAMLLGR
ncbi:hypothetical protein VW23_011125 [Devosia insulae DS-56]|uniref:CENP-V/GFA domain-containing protein n=1 Tax=Devosia insulae DS-56 TaxID=1116389 RepID=A0A1E5XVA8_9HYPH|nr:hypothetical protein [Devosia insulae]OEO32520.1 hypothetical protein VW23_011125 [Devosia insulae DS-56]